MDQEKSEESECSEVALDASSDLFPLLPQKLVTV